MNCDFCYGTPIVALWSHNPHAFASDHGARRYEQAACRDCSALIQQGARHGLVLRVADALAGPKAAASVRALPVELRRAIAARLLDDTFWALEPRGPVEVR